MSKLIVMILGLVILATILSDHSAQCWGSLQQGREVPCTCIVKGNKIVSVKNQHSSKVKPQNRRGDRRPDQTLFSVSIPV
ncbi:hypothetical protein Q7C36_004483 [Tachysurus vachellii]|uniref:Uncharacterized protein n=1 Tax=Tachysurus vachellii TaxID=175792 RepID=A0AA88NVV8_TACVA|nr:hypothetical protein Q7C36_004483 [Tachysurus vachellii]